MDDSLCYLDGVYYLKKICDLLYIEPGYYEDGEFGVRIESLMLITKADTEVFLLIVFLCFHT